MMLKDMLFKKTFVLAVVTALALEILTFMNLDELLLRPSKARLAR